MVTWGRVSSLNLRQSCWNCPINNEQKARNLLANSCHYYWLLCLGEKDFFKEAWAPCQDILWHWFALTSMLTKAWQNWDELHIVFDHYREDSIQNSKRRRRERWKEMVVLDMISLNQNVPVVLKNFGCLPSIKLCFRHSMSSGLLLITNT